MARRYGEPIDVRSDSAQGAPESFLWRGRVYLVRDVLDHWWERQAWWTAPAARAVQGDGEGAGDAASARTATRSALGTERELWRVEACRGRQGALGVFDLCHDYVATAVVPAGHGPVAASSDTASSDTDEPGRWHLVRVGD